MTDDVGFGAPSTFGGVIPTPALDRIAQAGLRYTQFHSTSLCSPTRAALITGRNHHAVGFGVVSEGATGFPGYDSIIPKDAASIGAILKENGYATSWLGKNHNTPPLSQAGPFDQWPIGMGFEYFYGFVGGDTSQWQPNLFRNTTAIYPYLNNAEWNLTTAMADDAIAWMNQLNSIDPSKPFFVYYVPGGTHAPHHPTPERSRRSATCAYSTKAGTRCASKFLPTRRGSASSRGCAVNGVAGWAGRVWRCEAAKWDTLSDDEKKMFIRQANVYGAISPTPTTRLAGSFRPSRTWASSTTR